MVFSTAVADQEDTLAAQYNNLRLDMLDPTAGHNHDGTSTGGRKIDHGDLLDTNAIAGTYLTHAKLNKHVQGTGTSADPDATGGAQGVHSLPAAAYVIGALPGTTQEGGASGGQLVAQWGINWVAAAAGGPTWFDSRCNVEFAREFDSVPIVFVTDTKLEGSTEVKCSSVTTRGFQAGFGYGSLGTQARTTVFNWIALGELSD